MMIHHYSASELRLLITKVKKRLVAIVKEITRLEERVSTTAYFRVNEVEVDSLAFLAFLDEEKEKFELELKTLEGQLFSLQRDME